MLPRRGKPLRRPIGDPDGKGFDEPCPGESRTPSTEGPPTAGRTLARSLPFMGVAALYIVVQARKVTWTDVPEIERSVWASREAACGLARNLAGQNPGACTQVWALGSENPYAVLAVDFRHQDSK